MKDFVVAILVLAILGAVAAVVLMPALDPNQDVQQARARQAAADASMREASALRASTEAFAGAQKAAAAAVSRVAWERAEAAAMPARSGALTVAVVGLAVSVVGIALGAAVWGNVYMSHRARFTFHALDTTGTMALSSSGQVATFAPLGRRGVGAVGELAAAQVTAPVTAQPAQVAALTAPAWDQVRLSFQPSRARLLLGYSQAGPLYAALPDLLSTAIVGRSGTGKSSLLRLIAVQATECGVRVISWDVHGTAGVAGVETCDTVRSIGQSAAGIQRLIDARYSRRDRDARPLLVLIDEAPLILGQSEALQVAVRRTVLEGRKVNVFMLLAGQSLPAKLFDGGTLVRDGLSSRFAFAASSQTARMVGIEGEPARKVPALPVGHAILDGVVVGRSGPTEIAVPWVPATSEPLPAPLPQDFPNLAREVPGSDWKWPEVPGSGPEVESRDTFEALPGTSGEVEVEVEAVANLVRSGASMTAAIREVAGVSGGRRYQELAAGVRQVMAT